MKAILTLCFLVLCINLGAQPLPVDIRPLRDHHFVGDNKALKDGVNCMVITSRKQYNKIFGTTSRPDTPHFEKEIMLVLVMPSTHKESRLNFNRVSVKAGQFIEVYCGFDLRIRPLTYDYNPLTACAIPRYPGINKINFYEERNMKLLLSAMIK